MFTNARSPNRHQITTQIQKLELDWPEQIRGFFQTLNLFSLSLSALSPRCVVSDWQYLNKVPITNGAPIGIFVFLLVHRYLVPRISYLMRRLCKAAFPSAMAPTKVCICPIGNFRALRPCSWGLWQWLGGLGNPLAKHCLGCRRRVLCFQESQQLESAKLGHLDTSMSLSERARRFFQVSLFIHHLC